MRASSAHPVAFRQMNSIWPQLEPLLAKVQKPARYIGCEDGAQRPDHHPGRVAWLLIYPDTYEIGLPNQGLQILYEILNERPDALAERTYAPWVDLEALLRAHDLPLFSVDTHRPAGGLRPAGLQPVGRARLHQPAELHRPGRRARAGRRPPPRGPADRRRRPLHLQPRAAGRLPRPGRAGRRRGGGQRDHRGGGRVEGLRAAPRARAQQVLRRLASVPGVYVPSMYEVTYEGEHLAAVTPRYPDVPAQVEKRTSPTWPTGPTRSASSSRSPRSCTTGSTSRCSAAAPGAAGSARRA